MAALPSVGQRAARGVLTRTARAPLLQARGLGDTTRGPDLADLQRNLTIAKEFFTKSPLSYAEYKQQCKSLRIFAVAGVTAGCALCLFWDPPKSSYWVRWGPTYWFSSAKSSLWGAGGPPLFLEKRRDSEVEVAVATLLHGGSPPPKAAPAAPATAPAAPAPATPPPAKATAPAAAPARELPKVIFVLGGPGAGKGTQCAKIVETFSAWAHISAGDCLRAERQDPNSKDGELINNFIKEGKIVPVEITVRLLQKAMSKAKAEDGKTCFLIDGFPRNLDNVTGWESVVGDSAKVCGVLFYEATEAQMEERLLGRGATSGRADDNIESIKKRFRTYVQETMPIVEKYKALGMVYAIDGMPPAEEVWGNTKTVVNKIEAMD